MNQTQSNLGISKSPVSFYMNSWGVVFSLLFVICAYALRKSVFAHGGWQLAAVWLIAIFGLGEGAGSGLFPYDHIAGKLTWSGNLHTIFSAIGDTAMVLLPFVLVKIFTKQHFPKLSVYSWFVAITGPVLIIVFLLARANYLPLRGLWQRLFLLDYYSLLMVVALDMLVTYSNSVSGQRQLRSDSHPSSL